MKISLNVNGKAISQDVPDNTLLAVFIRENLELTGTHIGCETAQCGACTVLVDGEAVKSCNLLVSQCAGKNVTTIEGLGDGKGGLHPMQTAFKECHGLQCGFCTPGMVMSAIDLCKRHPDADADTIREQIEGNICRCTGYQNIIKAIQKAQKATAATAV